MSSTKIRWSKFSFIFSTSVFLNIKAEIIPTLYDLAMAVVFFCFLVFSLETV